MKLANELPSNPASYLESRASAEDIQSIFRTMLGHETTSEHIDSLMVHNTTSAQVIEIITRSNELLRKLLGKSQLTNNGEIDDFTYRLPTDLVINRTELKRVLLVGSCMMEGWLEALNRLYPETEFDYLIFNNASALPEPEIDPRERYDFQLLQIPLRSILPEAAYLQLRFSDEAAYEALFKETCQRLSRNLQAIAAYNEKFGLTGFVVNFYTIQQNPMGRMQDRYSLSNMTYFIEQLNRYLYEQVKPYNGLHVIDFDEIANTFGKKYVAEDLIFVASHGAMLVDIEHFYDEARLEPLGSTNKIYGAQADKYIQTVFEEARSMHRTLLQEDSVKLVIFDLDDTLWRGIPAEKDHVSIDETEGWPIGVIEALSYLWRRGVMLAIVSKNDIENVKRIWDTLYGTRFSLDHFVMVAANWRSKAENIAEIIASVNVTPASVLFVDDNPVERASAQSVFPDLRVMSAPVVSWKRILLWSPETQRAAITGEAGARTDMVQAQIRRENDRASMGGDDFLHSLGLSLSTYEVRNQSDPRFDRCFELINKTNQFNTTGVRWTQADAQKLFDEGGCWLVLDVRDKYTTYGITGIVVLEKTTIRQFVLSCRVFGMGIETAGVALALRRLAVDGHASAYASVIATEKNGICRGVYADCGFDEVAPGVWRRSIEDFPTPEHIQVRW